MSLARTHGFIGIVVLLLSAPVHADEAAANLKALLEAKATSIVSIKTVIKTEIGFGGQTQDQESRMNIQGVVVDPGGLIVVSNSPFSPTIPGMSAQLDIKVVPVDFKVTIGQEEKEYDAFMVAKDTKLNLAFLQLKDLGERTLTAVDFDASVKPEVGTEIVAVTRLDKGYDYAPYFSLGRVSGSIKKPRRALMYTGQLNTQGLPVFTNAGELIGVITQIESGLKTDESEMNPMQMLSMLQRGNLGGGESFIVPASSIKGIIAQAKKRAGEMAAEEATEEKKEEK